MTHLKYFIIISMFFYGCQSNLKKEYYPSGKLKSEIPIKNGMKSGKGINYNESGTVSSTAMWANDLLNGENIIYNENGKINQINQYKNGSRCCTSKFYSTEGNLIEIQYLDDKERVVDYEKYKSEGVRNLSIEASKPIIISDADTVDFDNYYIAKIRLGNRRYDNIKVILGKPESNNDYFKQEGLPRADSVTSVLRMKAEKEGVNKVEGVIIEINKAMPDTLLAIPFSHTFFV